MASVQGQCNTAAKNERDAPESSEPIPPTASDTAGATDASASRTNKRAKPNTEEKEKKRTQTPKRQRGRPSKNATSTSVEETANESCLYCTMSIPDLQRHCTRQQAHLNFVTGELQRKLIPPIMQIDANAAELQRMRDLQETLSVQIDNERDLRRTAEKRLEVVEAEKSRLLQAMQNCKEKRRSAETENKRLLEELQSWKEKHQKSENAREGLKNDFVALQLRFAETATAVDFYPSDLKNSALCMDMDSEKIDLVTPSGSPLPPEPRVDEHAATERRFRPTPEETISTLRRTLSLPAAFPDDAEIETDTLTLGGLQIITPKRQSKRTSKSDAVDEHGNRTHKRTGLSSFPYVATASTIHSQASDIYATNRITYRSKDKDITEQLASERNGYYLPDLRGSGFEQQIVSRNEVVYKHTIYKDTFALLSSSFHKQSKSDITYKPICLGELIKTLPEALKMGEIRFSKEFIEDFKSIVADASARLFEKRI